MTLAVGFRLERDTTRVLVTPGVPATTGGTTTVSTLVCGWYPSAPLLAAVHSLATEFGFDYSDAYRRRLGALLDYSRLTSSPPISPADAATLRDAYFSGAGISPFYSWAYTCAYFNVPVVTLPTPEVLPVYRDDDTPGWDAAAESLQRFLAPGRAKFRVQPGKQFLVGLQVGDPLVPVSRFFGFRCYGDWFQDFRRQPDGTEPDVLTGNSVGGTFFPAGRPLLFSVELLHSVATFKVIYEDTGSTLYSATYALTGAYDAPGVWSLSAVIYSPGTWVEGIEVLGYSGGDGVLPPLRGICGEGTPLSGSIGRLPRLTGRAYMATRSAGVLPALLGLGGVPYSISSGEMPAMTSRASVAPPVSLPPRSAGSLPALTARGHSTVGTVGNSAGRLPALRSRGGRPIAECYGVLPPLQGLAAALAPGEARMYSHSDIAATILADRLVVVTMDSAGTVTAAMVSAYLYDADISSAAVILTPSVISAILDALMSTVVFTDAGTPLFDQPAQVWVLNLANNATSSYEGFDFNSFGTVSGKSYGVKADGVYLLEGATDAGAAIRASVSYGAQDFKTKTLKNMTRAYVGASSTGALYLKIIANGTEYVYQARASSAQAKQQRFDVGRGLKGTYFTFEIFNKDGGDFELDSVSFFAAEFIRRV